MVIRLIDTATLRPSLYESDKDIPSYAILSHTWEHGKEVTLQELEELAVEEISSPLGSMPERDSYYRPAHPTQNRTGFSKIVECCRKARLHSLKYVWIDTCCIDKKDPTELSEAINSMFRWYQHAAICYVYLPDVDLTASEWVPYAGKDELTDDDHDEFDIGDSNYSKILDAYGKIQDALEQCRWFTRGWCLQELIAPRTMSFYDTRWQLIGPKEELARTLSDITNVPQGVLLHENPLDGFPIAMRMSWAARRQTTRAEDRAYCLLGIFGIYMPLLYGEGNHAFRRLQEEIVKRSNDLSILAPLAIGGIDDDDERITECDGRPVPSDLFASGPEAFAKVKYTGTMKEDGAPSSFSVTNNGLHLTGARLKANLNAHVFTLSLNILHQLVPVPGEPIPRFSERTFHPLELFLRKIGASSFVPLTYSKKVASTTHRSIIWTDPEDIYIKDGGKALNYLNYSKRPEIIPYILGFTAKPNNIYDYPSLVRPVDPRPQWDLSHMGFLDPMPSRVRSSTLDRELEVGFCTSATAVAIDLIEAKRLLAVGRTRSDLSWSNTHVFQCCTLWDTSEYDPHVQLYRGDDWAKITGGREDMHTLNRIYFGGEGGYDGELQVGSIMIKAKIKHTGGAKGVKFQNIIHLSFETRDPETVSRKRVREE